MKKVVLVGAGARAYHMFAKPLSSDYQDVVEFKGVYDLNPIRAKRLSEDCGNVPVFHDFSKMLKQTKPDIVVIASRDDTHHTYIIESLEFGCDVISEKPMTIDAEKTRAIIEAEERTGRKVTVTFNLRFVPYIARVKELLKSGIIGNIQHVSLDWTLDRSHGADYFRRWHAELEHSGGLLVHKSTHHFDMINWWLDSDPKQVHAYGALRFYGPNREERGVRCSTCTFADTCEFYMDFSKVEFANRFYLEAEQEDGYFRDRCVFSDRIDIYDNMSVNVRYENDILLTYSLVAYSPDEGWKAVLHGDNGKLEVGIAQRGSDALDKDEANFIRHVKPSGEVVEYRIPASTGAHGGGDERLLNMLFAGAEDRHGQQAGSYAGAMSLLIGAAANVSIANDERINIQDLLKA